MNQVGAFLSLDPGDGILARAQSSDLGDQVSITGSLDGYGRTMTFSRFGITQSPLLYSFLRSLRAVLLAGYLGTPGNMDSAALFLGYFRQGSFTSLPPVATIECQDVSAVFANTPFEYYLAPKQKTTRLEILIDVILQYEIPCDIDTLDLGNNDGGVVMKGINEGGTNTLLNWIRDFLAPIGRHIYFRADGYMEVFRIDETATPVRTLTTGDILNMTVTPPAVNEVNSVSVTALCFGWVGPDGTRTVVETVDTPGSYTPVAATQKQDHTTGVIAGVSPAVTAQTITKRVITTTNYDGGTILSQTIDEYGWFAPKACQNQQNGAGVLTYNHSFDVYQFPDTTWRTQDQETFLLIKRTAITNNLTGDAITSTQVDYDGYVAIKMPIASRNTGVETPTAGFIAADGSSWWAGREINESDMPATGYEARTRISHGTERKITTYNGNAENESVLDSPVRVQIFIDNGRFSILVTSSPPVSGDAIDLAHADYGVTTDVFGPTAAKQYARNPALANPLAYFDFELTQIIRAAVSTTTYIQYAAAWGAGYPVSASIEYSRLVTHIDVSTQYLPLPFPIIEYRTAVQTPHPHTQTVTDQVRFALSGGIAAKQYLNFDMCETDDEAQVVAWENLRLKSAHVVNIETLLDLVTDEGNVLSIPIPEIGGGLLKSVVVWDIQRTVNGMGDARNVIKALYFPPELAATVI